MLVKIYVNLIKRGVKSIDDVPERLQEEVQAILSAESAV